MKEKWQIETYWSFSTPLTILIPSWKHYPIDLYLSEYILTLRMRNYMFNESCKMCNGRGYPLISEKSTPYPEVCPNCNGTKKEYQLNLVMCDCKEVVMTA